MNQRNDLVRQDGTAKFGLDPNGRPRTFMAALSAKLATASVQSSFAQAAGPLARAIMGSIIEVCSNNQKLQECDPNLVIQEAVKAATCGLSLASGLGHAYIIPYNKSVKVGTRWEKVPIPQMQLGYRGLIQLALRTRQYRTINADMLYVGESVVIDRLTGRVSISGAPTSDEAIGYFIYFETLDGFEKSGFMSRDDMLAHAQRYSKSWDAKNKRFNPSSAWATNFDKMGIKTMVRLVLQKYGPVSVEFMEAINRDSDADGYRYDAAPTPPALDYDGPQVHDGEDGHEAPDEAMTIPDPVQEETEVVPPFGMG